MRLSFEFILGNITRSTADGIFKILDSFQNFNVTPLLKFKTGG